jgi:hypothetical protein
MVKRYLLIAFYLLVLSFGVYAGNTEPEDDSTAVKTVDIKYNFKISGFILNFPDYKDYKAVLYSNDSTWEYRLYHNQVLIETRKSTEKAANTTKEAINVIFKDIERHNDVLLALSEKVHE